MEPDTDPIVLNWCRENGWEEPQWVNGSWWAIAPGSFVPVPLPSEIGQPKPLGILDLISIPRESMPPRFNREMALYSTPNGFPELRIAIDSAAIQASVEAAQEALKKLPEATQFVRGFLDNTELRYPGEQEIEAIRRMMEIDEEHRARRQMREAINRFEQTIDTLHSVLLPYAAPETESLPERIKKRDSLHKAQMRGFLKIKCV